MSVNKKEVVRIVMVGDAASGKTAMLTRYMDPKATFVDIYTPTIGVDFKKPQVVIQGDTISPMIWDTAGQERFRTITDSYYKGAHAFILVFDISNPHALENTIGIASQIDKIKRGAPGATITVVFNKSDKTHAISPETIQAFKTNHPDLQYMGSVSADTGAGIVELFSAVTEKGLAFKKQSEADKQASQPGSDRKKELAKLKDQIQKLDAARSALQINTPEWGILGTIGNKFSNICRLANENASIEALQTELDQGNNLSENIQKLQSLSKTTSLKNILATIMTALLCCVGIGLVVFAVNQKEKGNPFLFYTDSPKQAAEAAHNISRNLTKK